MAGDRFPGLDLGQRVDYTAMALLTPVVEADGPVDSIGWVKSEMYSLVSEVREDQIGGYYHLVTLWRATKEERELYEANA
jgi:hypothetical protein